MSEQERFTLHELAERFGQLSPPVDEGSPYLMAHRVAASIHGWDAHAYHYQDDPLYLTAEEYEAALEAGRVGSTPHAPAVPVPPDAEEIAARLREQIASIEKTKRDKTEAEKRAAAEEQE